MDFRKGETFTEPSRTVPGMDISVTELMEKFVRGETLPMGKATYYDGVDATHDDIDPTLRSDFDLVDAQQEMEKVQSRMQPRVEKKKEKKEEKEDIQTKEQDDKKGGD